MKHCITPRLSAAIMLIVLLVIASPAAAWTSTPIGVPRDAGATSGPIGLPKGCGGVTPAGETLRSCCISGYVWMDGKPIRGAKVTITVAKNAHNVSLTTDLHEDDPNPYYYTPLSGAPLDVNEGDVITVTARYSSHERSISYTARLGGQRVDVVLPKRYAHDYIFDRQIWGQANPFQFNNPRGVAVDRGGNLFVLDDDNARVQVFDADRRFVRQWGTLGNLPGQFSDPRGIALDNSGNVYVADTGNHRIQKFGPTGDLIMTWGGFGVASGQFGTPTGVAVDSAGNVYVLDLLREYGPSRIQKFNAVGDWLATFDLSKYGFGWSYTFIPNGIAISLDGFIYVSDTLNHRVLKLNQQGNLILTIGGIDYGNAPGEFNTPTGVAVDRDGNLYVADTQNYRVQKFSASGTPLVWGGSTQFSYPIGIAVDGSAHVYVADTYRHHVQQFGTDGSLQWTLGEHGAADGQFSDTFRLAVDQQHTLYVLDSGNYRVQRFDGDGAWQQSWPTFDTGRGSYLYPVGIGLRPTGDILLSEDTYDYANSTYSSYIHTFSKDGVWLGRFGGVGSDPGQFDRPAGVIADTQGYIYVADSYNERIQKFDSNGTPVTMWGSLGSGTGQLDNPGNLSLDEQENLYVVDGNNYRVQKFSGSGNWLAEWPTQDYPYGVALDNNSDVFITTSGDNPIGRYSASGSFLGTIAWQGAGPGEFNYPSTIVFASNRLYVADSGNLQVQVLRPMAYTLPVATINWVNTRSLVQGNDTLEVRASAADSDEDGDPAGFTYRWLVDSTPLVGYTSSTLTIPAAKLPLGTHSLGLEVVDDEGEVSERVTLPLDIAPQPRSAWTFMLYMDADSALDGQELYDQMSSGFGNGLLARLSSAQRAAPNPEVQVVAQIDGPANGDTRRLVLQPDGSWQPVVGWPREAAMNDPNTLKEFIVWARATKPSDHTYLAILGHGNGYQGTAWDDTSGVNAYLSVAKLRQGLTEALADGAAKIDVLHLDACSMALLDVSYELRNQVHYLVASQNLGWTFFLQDAYRAQAGAATTPKQLGEAIVTTYTGYAERESRAPLSREQYPYTIALLDLDYATSVKNEVDLLARQLGSFASQSSANRGILSAIRDQSQKFDSPIADYRISNLDEYVDLVDWAARLRDSTAISDPAIRQYAVRVLNAVRGGSPLVVAQRNSANTFAMPPKYGGTLIDLRGANGVSLYYPHAQSLSLSTVIWERYKTNQLFQFTADTAWDEFLRVGNGLLPPPGGYAAEPGTPSLAIPQQRSFIFVPIIIR